MNPGIKRMTLAGAVREIMMTRRENLGRTTCAWVRPPGVMVSGRDKNTRNSSRGENGFAPTTRQYSRFVWDVQDWGDQVRFSSLIETEALARAKRGPVCSWPLTAKSL